MQPAWIRILKVCHIYLEDLGDKLVSKFWRLEIRLHCIDVGRSVGRVPEC